MTLIAVVGDLNSHGAGELTTPPQTKFKIGGKLVATVDTVAAPDNQTHVTGQTNAASGASKFKIGGKAIHRHGDSRYCGATTIATGQSTFSVGG